MKKSYLKVLILEILMLISIITCFILMTKNTINNIVLVIVWSLIIFVFHFLVGIESDRSQNKIDTIQIIFVYVFIYYIIIYIMGLFVGFTRNPYSLDIISVLKNILPIVIIIIMQEIFRFNVIVKCKNNKIIMHIMIMIFISYEIAINYSHYSLVTGMDIFELIGVLILPSIVNNIVITFMSYKGGYFPTILYRILTTCLIYIVPIYPDLNIYLKSVIGLIFPTILFLKFNTIFATNKFSKVKRHNLTHNFISIIFYTFAFSIIILISGVFKYQAMAIGSNSMHPVFNKGDAVIITKIDDSNELSEGKIIVYYHDDIVVVHRIYKITNKNNKIEIITKGDNNNDADAWIVYYNDIKGIVNHEVPLVGWPSVWITELIKK